MPHSHPSLHRLIAPLAAALLLAAALIPSPARGADATVDQARAALAKATGYMRSISTEGGYLWWYSADLKERAGEEKATPTQVWIQPPGTPSMGQAFLRAYAATKDPQYLQAAQAAAACLATGQLASGGWDYKIDFDPKEAAKSYRRTDVGKIPPADTTNRRNISTYDDNNSQSAMQFLMAFHDTAKSKPGDLREIRTAMEYGLGKMLEAQYPNGAWPQRYDGKARDPKQFPVQAARVPTTYPRDWPKPDYKSYYTLNDNTQRDCILTMLDAYHRYGRPEYLAAAKKGGDFLILAQLPADQPTWSQQYNAQMEPAWARAFEPPAACSSESVGACRTLMQLYRETGDEKYLKPIPAAIDWFKRSTIAPNTWARYYELGTNKPIYGDRDGKIHYTLEELTPERRTGYSWRGPYNVAEMIAEYEKVREKPAPPKPAARRAAPANEERVKTVIASLDDQGRWLTGGRIQTRTFIQNAGLLCDYLEAAGK